MTERYEIMFVGYTDTEKGDLYSSSWDLLVVAKSREEATKLWREYYKHTIDGKIEEDFDQEWEPDFVYRVPVEKLLIQGPQVFPWREMEKV